MRLPYAGLQEGLARCASVSRACSLPLLCPREGRHVLATTPPPRTQRSELSCALLGPENRLQDELSCKGRATRALSISMGRGRGAATLQQDTCITYETVITGGSTARPAACIIDIDLFRASIRVGILPALTSPLQDGRHSSDRTNRNL